MRICFLLRDCFTEKKEEADVYLLPFSALGEIDYEKEWRGENDGLERFVKLSRSLNAVVIGGCRTNLHGIRKKSVAVAEKGKLLGLTDKNTNFEDPTFRAGAEIKVFPTGIGRIAAVSDDDILFPEIVKSLSLCGCELLFCVREKIPRPIEQIVVRANAYVCGIGIALCAEKYAFAVAADGRICFQSGENRFVGELTAEREYRLIQRRVRGYSDGEK